MRTRTTATACGAFLVAVVVAGVSPILGQQEKFDLLVRGGHVIDPRNGINSVMDVAIAAGKIAEVAGRIDNLDLPLDVGAVFVLRVERPARASS